MSFILKSNILAPLHVIAPGAFSVDNYHVVDAGGENVCIVNHPQRSVARARAAMIAQVLGDLQPLLASLAEVDEVLRLPHFTEIQRLTARRKIQLILAALEGDR